jgi:hypothetical protein
MLGGWTVGCGGIGLYHLSMSGVQSESNIETSRLSWGSSSDARRKVEGYKIPGLKLWEDESLYSNLTNISSSAMHEMGSTLCANLAYRRHHCLIPVIKTMSKLPYER